MSALDSTDLEPDAIRRLMRRNEKLTALLGVAKAMMEERNVDALLDLIMQQSARIVDAERCTLFLASRDGRELTSKIAHGLEDVRIIRLPVGQGIAGQVAKSREPLNIPDAYRDPRFNRDVDALTGYRTTSILCVPMLRRDQRVVGVVQALNHKDGPFSSEDCDLLLALGAHAASAIENANLYDEIERLFEGFVRASVTAIESRDPTTSGHSERVAALCTTCFEVLPRASAAYASLVTTPDAFKELRYAALLHDFGKVGVRENVLVKANKLHAHELSLVEARFEVAQQADEIAMLRAQQEARERLTGRARDAAIRAIEHAWSLKKAERADMLEFIRRCNRPTILDSGDFVRLGVIQSASYLAPDGSTRALLTDHEVRCLSIPKGSLSHDERREIEGHVVHTYNFLRQIPWTDALGRVPAIARGHHEKLDGSGYPSHLGAVEIPIQTRIMTIADIYDALTAHDRPYKSAVPHERALAILEDETRRGALDGEIFRVFIEANVPDRAADRQPTLFGRSPLEMSRDIVR